MYEQPLNSEPGSSQMGLCPVLWIHLWCVCACVCACVCLLVGVQALVHGLVHEACVPLWIPLPVTQELLRAQYAHLRTEFPSTPPSQVKQSAMNNECSPPRAQFPSRTPHLTLTWRTPGEATSSEQGDLGCLRAGRGVHVGGGAWGSGPIMPPEIVLLTATSNITDEVGVQAKGRPLKILRR